MKHTAALALTLLASCISEPRTGPVRPSVQNTPTHTVIEGTLRIRTVYGGGSGIAWDGSHVVTAKHVVDGEPFLLVTGKAGDTCHVTDVWESPGEDIAVLEVAGCTLHPLLHGKVEQGDEVWATGSPIGLDWSISRGIVSAVRPGKIQTDAAINPGMSGGPVVNKSGELVGMSVAVSSTDGFFAGIGWAVPVDLLERAFRESSRA